MCVSSKAAIMLVITSFILHCMCFGLQQNMKVLKEPVLQRSPLQKSAAYSFSYTYLYLLLLGNLSSIFFFLQYLKYHNRSVFWFKTVWKRTLWNASTPSVGSTNSFSLKKNNMSEKNSTLVTSGTATVKNQQIITRYKTFNFHRVLRTKGDPKHQNHGVLQLSAWFEGQSKDGVSLPPLPHSAHLPSTGWHSPDPRVSLHRGTSPFLWQETVGAAQAKSLHWGDLWSSLLSWVSWQAARTGLME